MTIENIRLSAHSNESPIQSILQIVFFPCMLHLNSVPATATNKRRVKNTPMYNILSERTGCCVYQKYCC